MKLTFYVETEDKDAFEIRSLPPAGDIALAIGENLVVFTSLQKTGELFAGLRQFLTETITTASVPVAIDIAQLLGANVSQDFLDAVIAKKGKT